MNRAVRTENVEDAVINRLLVGSTHANGQRMLPALERWDLASAPDENEKVQPAPRLDAIIGTSVWGGGRLQRAG